MTQKIRLPLMRIGQFRRVAILSTLGLMVTACAVPQAVPAPSINNNGITISESIERLELYSRPNGMSLSSRDQSAVAEFLSAYGQFGDGPLYINVPGAQSGAIGTQQSAQLVRQTMAQMGMGVGAIQSGQYQSNPSAPAPVVVSYRRLKVVPQDCRGLGNLMETHANRPMPSFGCAYHANLGAMIQDPRQLLEPYALGQPNAERRRTVYDKYILGELTGAAKPNDQERGTDE